MLRFNKACGNNIELSEDGCSAVRTESFANALAFSHRPLEENELFLVEIQDHEKGWAGNIRCGVTLHNPACIEIPQYLLPDLYQMGNSYVFALKPVSSDPFNDVRIGDWNNQSIEGDKRKLPNKNMETVIRKNKKIKYCDNFNRDVLVLDPSCHPCAINSRIGFFVSRERELYFLINGEQFGPCARNIPKDSNVYAAVDLYGMTKQVKIIHSCIPKLSMCCKDVLWKTYTEEELRDVCLPKILKREVLAFYSNCNDHL